MTEKTELCGIQCLSFLFNYTDKVGLPSTKDIILYSQEGIDNGSWTNKYHSEKDFCERKPDNGQVA